MKELDRISDYITQLENERAELNKQVDKLKEQLNKVSTTATDSAELKSVDDALTTPNDEVTVLHNYIKRLGTAVEWTYADQEEPWTDSQINELVAIVEGNHIARKNLDTMADEIESITREIQNDNFGLYRTFNSMHIALNTYKFEPTRELAETIQKLADAFIQSCSHLDVAIGNLKVAQLCDMNEEIEDCQDYVHAWIGRSGASRWLDHRP